ncbi:superoxide dismutase, Fe-Mn family [Sinomicrobium oceani]|uniref:Superoxide dismutase n=1 Tax=Sinomicrobium oceani TaxID=1150368 RepID=A0A1K1MDB6_9FLAO|nr:superoxide dismutase [Sinomicrobium oceani]SFW21120.1 superoxide dismutase, Fe-Mn family [Sinomicrobium oceani]
MSYELKELPYGYDALFPYIDAETMQIHHTKHHAGYVSKLNAALKEENIQPQSLEKLLTGISGYSAGIRNNAGGHYNHSLFWSVLSPEGGGKPSGALAEAIDRDFGSFGAFQEAFRTAAASRFGSGWAWLILTSDQKLKVTSTPNQDNPLMDVAEVRGLPLLGLDVWEHAYYLKYQNKRPEYIEAFWHIINWSEVEKRFGNHS